PLLRHDFQDIYMSLKRKGLLVSVFTNATLIRDEHIALFRKYPPRDIEVTIYGSRQEIYEAVTRKPGSFATFQRGVNALLEAGVKLRMKAMALRSNLSDMDAITAFGQHYTKDFYRFDPVLHLRYDCDPQRNAEIKSERLAPEEIVGLEKADRARFESMGKNPDKFFIDAIKHRVDNHLFHCGTGNGTFTVGYDGTFRLCSSLFAPGTTTNLRKMSLREAWEDFVPLVRDMRTENMELLNTCGKCPIVNLCMNCPAHAYLETGRMDSVVPYFCHVAHARAGALQESLQKNEEIK
ncbi:MAG: radical SAM protein, partial [Chloroflexota bacterium]|nr:radical SAM protein [Chloroflexota bacterium]